MVKYVNSAELKELIETSNLPVFCDFWATWCGPCRMLAPVYEDVSDKYEGKAVFVKIDVDENEDAAMEYAVTSIPNITCFRSGVAVDKNIGFVPQDVLELFIEKNL